MSNEKKRDIIPFKKQKLYYIKWQDAHSSGGWLSENELINKVNNDMCICEEVGWVVYEDDHELHICARRVAWSKNDTSPAASRYGQYERIPKTWIMKRRKI